MATSTTQGDRLWTEFRALPRESRDAFLLRLVSDVVVREELKDLLDFEVAEERSTEPTRSLQDVLNDLES